MRKHGAARERSAHAAEPERGPMLMPYVLSVQAGECIVARLLNHSRFTQRSLAVMGACGLLSSVGFSNSAVPGASNRVIDVRALFALTPATLHFFVP